MIAMRFVMRILICRSEDSARPFAKPLIEINVPQASCELNAYIAVRTFHSDFPSSRLSVGKKPHARLAQSGLTNIWGVCGVLEFRVPRVQTGVIRQHQQDRNPWLKRPHDYREPEYR